MRSLTLANPGSAAKVIIWLLERQLPADVDPCDQCGHGPYHHRLDDSRNIGPVDPRAEFRCIWPMPDGPAVELCECHNYVRPTPVVADGFPDRMPTGHNGSLDG